ncbi:hypothetical protein, partial [Lactococcus garvieae]|uniref:hypothetical protein n=1 Tax=Lactococcus garvieae TaxID=1363 RepID=UPI0023EA94FF
MKIRPAVPLAIDRVAVLYLMRFITISPFFIHILLHKRPKKYRESVRPYLEKISLDFFVRYSLYGAADEERFWEAYHA